MHCSALIEAVAATPAQAESLRERLRATVPMADASDMWRATFALIELHREVGWAAAERHGLPYPDELANVVGERLREEERLDR